MKKRLLRWVICFLVIPVVGGLLALVFIRQGLIWYCAGTAGLAVRTTTFQGQPMRYAVIEPESRFEGPRPLVIVLHGAFECGDDGVMPARPLPAAFVQFMRSRAGARVLLPQFPATQRSWTREWHPRVLHLLEEVRQQHEVDPNRTYLLGLSMGGQGCWCLASEYPDLFAAAMPMCGQGNPEWAPRLKELPIWAFHGDRDAVIPVSGSREMVEAVRQAGGERLRYTEYEDVGHDCWTRTLADLSVLEWLVEQSKDGIHVP